MVMVSGLIGLPFAFINKIESANKTLRYIAGFASLLIGANILYEIAIVNNLFGI